MGVAVIAANTSIKYGPSLRKVNNVIVGSNGDTGRVTWYNAPANGVTRVSFDYKGTGLKSELIPFVTFSVAGGGSNNRESFTQVWVDNVLVYSNQQTNGGATGFTVYLNDHADHSLRVGATIEYRLQSNKDVGGLNARQINTGYLDTSTGLTYASDLILQEMINSP